MSSVRSSLPRWWVALPWLASCAGAAAPGAPPGTAAVGEATESPVTEQAVCGAAAVPALQVSAGVEPPEVGLGTIASVRIEGAGADGAALAAELSPAVGERLDPGKVRADLERLWGSGRFEDIAVMAHSGVDGLELVYQVRPRLPVGQVFLRGTEHLSDHRVSDAVQVHSGERFDPADLRWSRVLLRQAYVRAGYWFAKVEAKQLRADAVHLCLEVDEGPKVTIESWTYPGAKRFSDSELRAQTDTQDGTVNTPGGVYRPDTWTIDALRVLALYYDHGHVSAQLAEPQLEFSEDRRRLQVQVAVEEGPVYRVGTISFSGDALVAGQDYPSAVHTKSGDVFARTKLMEDMARIRELHEQVNTWTPAFEVTPNTTVDSAKAVIHIDFQLQ